MCSNESHIRVIPNSIGTNKRYESNKRYQSKGIGMDM